MITILLFILILSLLVLTHEAGHLLLALKCGAKVEEFALGLPFTKPLWSRNTPSGIKISLYPVLFGGFVKLYGEEEEEEGKMANDKCQMSNQCQSSNDKCQMPNKKGKQENGTAFFELSATKRALIIVAGVVANFLLAVIFISIIFTQGVMAPAGRVHVENVTSGSPAAEAGIKTGDIITKFSAKGGSASGGKAQPFDFAQGESSIKSTNEVIEITKKYLGEEMEITIWRESEEGKRRYNDNRYKDKKYEELTLTIVPRQNPPEGEGPLGIELSEFEEKKYSIIEAPVLGTIESFNISWHMVLGLKQMLSGMIKDRVMPEGVAGPVGIAKLAGEAASFGPLAVLQFIGILSLNLAVVNILPFPALDGGRLVFIGIEKAVGKKARIRWEKRANLFGMICLLALIVVVTLNDIRGLFSGLKLL
ncbi:MAG: M50 family metallopeptidase [bacterium]|nr:M50 family metallopeptidase [bacterium]